MPELDSTTLTKIAALRTISDNWSERLEVYELLRISWATGDQYYAVTPSDEISSVALPVSPVNTVIIPKSSPAHFFDIESDTSLGDEEIPIEIWDGGFYNAASQAFENGGVFADLIEANGEGTAAEVFLWFPAADLLLSVWQGHLRNSEESDAFIWSGKIANGFRSPNLPMPRRAHYTTCQATYGLLLNSIAEIAENDCPIDAHLPGGTIGNADFPTCPRKVPANCVERGISALYHFSHQSQSVTVLNNQTTGPQLQSISRGNESNLKEPVRVVMGVRRVRDMQVLAYRRDYNNNNPAQGFFYAMYEACEGPIREFRYSQVNGTPVQAQHYSYRYGYRYEIPVAGLSTHGYSGTAYIVYNYQTNPGTISPESIRGSSVVFGLVNVRRYTDATTFVTEWTNSRAWQIARMYCDKRWGLGYDYARLGILSFIECDDFQSKYVTFTDPDGTSYSFYRAISDVELVERAAQQQVEDMCLSGRFSRPFVFQGKTHIIPLRGLDSGELAAVPVFSDNFTANTRKIVWEEQDGVMRPTTRRSQKSDLDIPNRVEGTYHDSTADWTEQPAPPAEDIDQQLKAGQSLGDTSRRVVTKKYSLLGVVQKGHAVSLEYFILNFGEFCEGGIKNNLRVKFKIWYLDALDLYQAKVIKIVSDQLTRYGFDYFRIINIKRAGNLHVELTVQAHDNDALLNFDTESGSPFPPGEPSPTPSPGPQTPCALNFGAVAWVDGIINIPVEPC